MDIIAKYSEHLGHLVDSARVHAATMALLQPFGLGLPLPGNEFNGCSLSTVAEVFARTAGHVYESKPSTMAFAMGTTSDFPALIGNIIVTALAAGWEAGSRSFERFVAPVPALNFKPQTRVRVGGFSTLAKIREGQSIPAGGIREYMNTLSVERHGRILKITRELALNGNLAPIIEGAQLLGRAAAASLSAVVFATIQDNPTLADGGALFNSDPTTADGGHANLAASGGLLSASTLGAAKGSMRHQTAPAGDRPLNIRPRLLLVSAEQEDEAWDLVGLPGGFGESGSEEERYMVESGRVELISAPELTGNAWYLAADSKVAPIIEVAYLDGVAMPTIVPYKEFSSDALQLKVLFDFGVAPGDFRGGYKNAGA